MLVKTLTHRFTRRAIRLACLALAASLQSPTLLAATYLVNPGDILRVDVWNEDSLSSEVRVRPDGAISLPMAGEIDTSQSTPEQVAQAISTALMEFMKDEPRVVVSVLEATGNRVFVIGKVERPGAYPLLADTDVMQALALAGGLNAFAAENGIRILRRRPDGTQIAIPFEYARVKAGKDLESNITLRSRDVVVVP